MLLLHGGNGFLGTHIARVAAGQGIDVAITGRREAEQLSLPARVAYAQVGSDAYRERLRQAETIVYLAHASRPSGSVRGLSHEFDTNIAALNRFVQTLVEQAFSGQFFYASSGGQVYGRRDPVPAVETDPALPCTDYGFGKLVCEQIVEYASRVDGLDAAILRVANPVGKAQIGTGHGLIGAIFKALMDGRPLTLFGSGTNHRDYFSADDLGRFLTALHGSGWRGRGVYNIGSGTGHTERDVLALVGDRIGRVPDIAYREARPFDLPYAVVDPSKARRELGWAQTETLEQVIDTIAGENPLPSPTRGSPVGDFT